MSLQINPVSVIPEQTKQVAQAAFPKGNLYLRVREELGVFFTDAQFADLFASQGQQAQAPWRLALVCVFQFAEGLSDRQAADAVRSRIDWKYALAQRRTCGSDLARSLGAAIHRSTGTTASERGQGAGSFGRVDLRTLRYRGAFLDQAHLFLGRLQSTSDRDL